MSEPGLDTTVAGTTAQDALRRAAEWRLLGMLFERPRPAWCDELRRLADEVGDAKLGAATAAALDSDEGSYLRIVGHGGAVSPRAVTYRLMEDPGRILADLAGLYEAFRFRPGGEDPADHVATEVGFAGYLALKQAYARSIADQAKASTTEEALRGFLTDHLAPFAAALARRMNELQIEHPLATAARLLVERTGAFLAPQPEGKAVNLPIVDEGGDFGCPGCG